MRHRIRRTLLPYVAVCALAIPARGQSAQPLPAKEELHQLLDSGQYQVLLQKVSRVLGLRPDAAQGYDRADLFMMKGEAQLHLKQIPAAADAFAQAGKEAKDLPSAATAIATEALVRKSPGLKYKPKGATAAQAVDVLDRGARKGAFALLYADETAEAAPKLKAAASATSLPPLMDALKNVSRLRALEIAATGKDDQTMASVKDLADRARQLMADAVRSMSVQVQQISQLAHTQLQTRDRNGFVHLRERGLDASNTATLKETINTADRIIQVSKDLASASKVEALQTVTADAEKVRGDASQLLQADYTLGDRAVPAPTPYQRPARTPTK